MNFIQSIPPIDHDWVARQLEHNLTRVLSPVVCHQLFESLHDPNANFATIAKLLHGDPYIAMKVFALANTIYPQSALTIRSLKRAVQMLGTRQMRLLVLGVLLAGPLLTPDPHVPRRVDLWRWIFGCAIAGDWLGEQGVWAVDAVEQPGPGENLLQGLALGIGPLVLYAGLGRTYGQVLGQPLRPINLAQRESRTLGVDHYRVGLWAMHHMRCPQSMSVELAALASGSNQRAARNGRLIQLLGAWIAGAESRQATTMFVRIAAEMGLDPQSLMAIDLPHARKRVRELGAAFKLDLEVWQDQHVNIPEILLAISREIQDKLTDNLHDASDSDEAASQG